MRLIPISTHQADTALLQERLAATPISAVCTYAALSEAIGRDVQGCRFLVLRAMRRANTETGAIFSTVLRVGYKRLPPEDAHQIGSTSRAHIRHAANRSASTIANALSRANAMPDDSKRRALAEISTLNMLAHLSTERVTKAMPAADHVRPTADSLREILRHIGADKSEKPA
jgi:hypothetical protein